MTTAPTEVRAKSHCTKSGDVGNIQRKSIPLNQAADPESPPQIPVVWVGGWVGLTANPLQFRNIVNRSNGFRVAVEKEHETGWLVAEIDLAREKVVGQHVKSQ